MERVKHPPLRGAVASFGGHSSGALQEDTSSLESRNWRHYCIASTSPPASRFPSSALITPHPALALVCQSLMVLN
jgi:hypothetical protein